MSSAAYKSMRDNPKFQELVSKRGRFAWTLSIIVLSVFYGFVMIVAFFPGLLGEPLATGSMWTVGVLAGLFMFVFFWLLTALYVRRANTEFDGITREIIQDASSESLPEAVRGTV